MSLAVALVALAAMVLGESWRLDVPGSVRDAPLSQATAVALGLAAAWPAGGGATGLIGPLLVCAAAVAVAGLLRRHLAGILPDLLRLWASVVIAGLLVRVPWAGGSILERLTERLGRPAMTAVVVLGVAVAAVAVPQLVRSLSRRGRAGVPATARLSEDLGRHGPLGMATASTATVMALGLGVLGPLSVVLSLVPLLVLQPAVNRQRRIRLAQQQTVVALARLTEEAGLTALGHSGRVAELAVPVARDLGVREADLEDVRAAALLHDIGQVGLGRPIPGGATVEVSLRDQRRIAATGAAILARTAELSRLAPVVADVGVPQWRAEERGDVPWAARVIRVVSAYDDLAGRSTRLTGGDGPAGAVERLLRSTPHEYDPVVVAALVRQLERHGVLGPGPQPGHAGRHG